MLSIPLPRLLPTTIATMATLLVVKSIVLLDAAITHGQIPQTAIFTLASAAGAEHMQEAPKPVPAAAAPQPPPAGQKTEAKNETPKAGPGVAPAPANPSGQSPNDSPVQISDSEKALLQELRQRRKELEARADAIATRESVLVAAEQKIGARVSELQSLQKRLEGLDAAQRQKEDAGWQAMVKLYEAMKPKEAANIFNELSMPVLLQVMDRMKDAKAAAVMAAMSPDKARDVTDGLAQLRTGKDPAAAAALKSNPLGG